MPSSYSFLTFSNVENMRNRTAKAQIRKHAMKDIGFSRRRNSEDIETPLEAPHLQPRQPRKHFKGKSGTSSSSKAANAGLEHHLPLMDDRSLYNPCIRALCCATDPFDTASVHLDSATVDLLTYFAYYSSRMPTSFVFLPNVIGSIEEALKDDLFLQCLLSAAASRAIHVDGLQIAHFKQKELVCTQNALEALRERLKQVDAELSSTFWRAIGGMVYLCAAALYRDDPTTAKVHIRFAIKLAESIGGMNRGLDPQLVMRALGLDDMLACRELIPCSVKCTYDPGPSPYIQPERQDQQPDDEGCSAAALVAKDNAVLPESLRQMALQTLETLRVKRKVEKEGHLLCGQALGERQWLIFRTLAIRNRLLAFSPTNKITNALRIALILFTLLPPCESRQDKTAQMIAKRLRLVLSEITDAEWSLHEDIRLWCLLMGYFSVFGTTEIVVVTWFVGEIGKIIEAHGTTLGISFQANLLNDLINFQRGYLFRERQRSVNEWLVKDLRLNSFGVAYDSARAQRAAEIRCAIPN